MRQIDQAQVNALAGRAANYRARPTASATSPTRPAPDHRSISGEVGLEGPALLFLGDVTLVGQHLLLGPFGALPLLTPDLGDPLLLCALFPEDGRFDLVGQDAAGQEPVQGLGPLLLALDLASPSAGA